MTGVQVGTRLAQLLELRSRLDHEITAERLRVATDGGRLNPTGPVQAVTPFDVHTGTTEDLLARLGVTARDVKEWAITQGLRDRVQRGRPARELVEAYAYAHARTRGDRRP